MKIMKYSLVLALLVFGVCSSVNAEEKSDFPRISFVGQGSGNPPPSKEYVKLVVEGPYLSFEKNPVPDAGAVDYINNVLKIRDVSFIAVYTRDGVKYGDVVKAIDLLRKTNAKQVGVSMVQVAPGREP